MMSQPVRPSPKTETRLQVSLAATGWAACIGLWFLAMAAIAIFGGESPLALAALMALFAGGLVALVVLRLTGIQPGTTTGPPRRRGPAGRG